MTQSGSDNKTKRLFRFGWYELPENNSIVRFCQDSGLHGLKYITGPKQHLCERLLWLVAFIAAGVSGSVLIYNTWLQYHNLPVVYVQSPKQLMLKNIPFPSVTICSLSRAGKGFYEYYNTLSKQDDDGNNAYVQEAKEIVKVLDTVCDPRNILLKSLSRADEKLFGMGILSSFLNLELSQSFQNKSKILKLLRKSTHLCEDMMPILSIDGNNADVRIYIERLETDFGICCTYNTVPIYQLKPWKVKGNYNHNYKPISMDTLISTSTRKGGGFPRQQNLPGISHGLSFVLKKKLNESYCNNTDSLGFLMSIDNPLNTPTTKDKEIVIDLYTEVFFAVKAKVNVADDSIKRFTPVKRGCYFDNEWKLRDYSIYTKANCWQECVANLTTEHCQDVADCWTGDDGFLGIESKSGIWIYDHLCERRKNETCSIDKLFGLYRFDMQEICKHCLPTCNDIKYAYNIKLKPLKDDYIEKLEKSHFGVREDGVKSIVHVYFDEYHTTPTLAKEQFGILELLANSGGLLGLCLGFSGISILEIIYYFTIRVCFRRFRRKVLGQSHGVCHNENTSQAEVDHKISLPHMTQAEIEKIILQHQSRLLKLEQSADLSERRMTNLDV